MEINKKLYLPGYWNQDPDCFYWIEVFMEINFEILKKILSYAAKILKENEKELCLLDSNIGDGDHGLSMSRIADIMEKNCLMNDTNMTISNLFEKIGYDIMSFVGGSSGMLWGTFFNGMVESTRQVDSIDSELLKTMLEAAVQEVGLISKAKVGDKTMMKNLVS